MSENQQQSILDQVYELKQQLNNEKSLKEQNLQRIKEYEEALEIYQTKMKNWVKFLRKFLEKNQLNDLPLCRLRTCRISL